tara:strand:- start:753 stop:1184 length:432 start_codon:yes stop_codon:yes gene_type:complete
MKKMKKIYILLVFIIASTSIQAQNENNKLDPNYESQIIKFMKIQTGDPMNTFLVPLLEKVPEKDRQEVKNKVQKIVNQYYKDASLIYSKYYSQKDMENIMEFYETPIGKKIQENNPKINKETMKMMDSLSTKLQPIFMDYIYN